MTPDELAERLHEAHADAEPLELPPDLLREWIGAAGGDPDDTEAAAAAVVAWSHLIL